MALNFAAAIPLGYFLGAIPFGLVVGKLARAIDVRQYGSGKIGFANVLRTVGFRAGVVVLVADIAKAALAVLLARLIVGSGTLNVGDLSLDFQGAQVMAALAAIMGHNWSVYIKFQGGRGFDPFLGGLIAMSPPVGAACGAITVIVIILSRYVSLGSILGTLSGVAAMAPLVVADRQPAEFLAYTVVAASLVLFQHRDNIRRLLAGTERKLGERAEPRQRV